MVDLAAIGRAQPSRSLERILNVQNTLRSQERADMLAGSRMALESEQLAQMRRKGQWEAEDRARANMPIDWDSLTSTFYGGSEGAMAQYATRIGKSYNLLDKIDGNTIIRSGDAESGMKILSEDTELGRGFLRAGLGDANKNIAAIQQQMAEKPNDKNLIEQLKVHRAAKQDFLKRLDGLQSYEDEMAARKEAERKAGIEERETTAEEGRLTETIRHNKAMEKIQQDRLNILSNTKPGKGADNKTLQEMEADIRSVATKIESVRSGQDIMSEAWGSEKSLAVLNLERQLNTMLKAYIKAGGSPDRVGFGAGEVVETGTIIVNKQTGERRQWNGAEWEPLQ